MEITASEHENLKENQCTEEEELINDFSVMFKGKGFNLKKMPKLSSSGDATTTAVQTPNWLLEIPAKLDITKENLCERKVLDQRRWKSMVRCNDDSSKIIAAVTSVWNYFFSTTGLGTKKPLTLKAAKQVMAKRNIAALNEDEESRQQKVVQCFEELCLQTSDEAECYVEIKPTIPNKKTEDINSCVDSFLQNLTNQKSAYIYLTYQNILCPIGFQQTPLAPLDAYKKLDQIHPEKLELWITSSSTHRFEPSLVIKRWRDIKLNLETAWPNYLNLEECKKGLQRYEDANEQNEKEERGNNYCLIRLTKK